jgi:hypothetical protein
MKPNESTIDRIIRLIVGLALIVIGSMAETPTLMWVLVIVGIMVTITAATGWCGLYALLGISTKKESASADEPQAPAAE